MTHVSITGDDVLLLRDLLGKNGYINFIDMLMKILLEKEVDGCIELPDGCKIYFSDDKILLIKE